MNKLLRITIDYADLGFLLGAIEMRSTAMIDSILKEIEPQTQIKEEPFPQTNWTVSATDDGGLVATKNPVAKKRGRPRKDPAAPRGYKKDGTPKKAPGRPKVSK